MAKLTLQQARAQLYDAVVPNLDSQANIDLFDRTLNFACERLINSGSWLGQYEHIRLLIPEGRNYVTLPPEYISIEAMSYEIEGANGCVTRTPVQIRNEWVSVLSYGPFLWDWSLWGAFGFAAYNSYSTDAGDGFVTFRDAPYDAYTLRFEIENAQDAGKVVLVKGKDAEGNPIYTPGSSCAYQGSEYTLTYPDTEPAQVYTEQIYFIQKECFQGYLKLYAVDVDTGEETQIGLYRPSETDPCYKRYYVKSCCNTSANSGNPRYVRAIAKLRYLPMVADQDSVVPAQYGALRTALTAIVYEQQNDPGRRDTEMDRAIELLNNELRSSRGGAAMRLNIDPNCYNFAALWPGR